LLEAAQHYLNGLQSENDEVARLLLKDLRLDLVENLIQDFEPVNYTDADYVFGNFEWKFADAIWDRVCGWVEALFNYDLLNVRQIAFDYGERLRLYAYTQQGWVITQLGQVVRHPPDVEAVTLLLVLETMRAMLDQDDWFISRQRLQWLLDESPVRFDLYAETEEAPIAEELKEDDRWLRRLRWLGIVTYTHHWSGGGRGKNGFNQREANLTPLGRTIVEAILASPSLLDNVQSLGLAPPPQPAVLELDKIREMIASLHILVSTLQTNFSEVQSSFERRLSEMKDATQRDLAYQQVHEDLHQLAVRSLAQVDDRIREYERQLAKRLRETWHQLGEEAQYFLASAEYLYSDSKGAKRLDFAPAAVEYCKVVETELEERLFQPLKEYLLENAGPEVKLKCGRDELTVNEKSKPPAMGQLANLLKTSRKSEQNQVVRDFLANYYAPAVQEFILQDLPGKLEITTEYRNGAAHTKRLSQEEIEEFRAMLFGGEDGSNSLLQQIVFIQPATQ
jgi:hypothetical protein